MKQYFLAMDQGTTSSRAILYDAQFHAIAMAQKDVAQYYLNESWVEQDPNEIFETQLSVAKEVMQKAGISPKEIASIGITNQRETTILWDRKTGKPIYQAIVWMCKRTSDLCEQIKNDGYAQMIREKTGLVVDPYFSATKIQWILNHVPGAKEKAAQGDLLFGTVDSWLIYRFTGGKVHATDSTNASRTMLFNIHTGTFDQELLDLFSIPSCMLPNVFPCDAKFGETDPSFFDGCAIPIGGVAGDQQAALFGHCCFEAGSAKNTYGTGCFTLLHTGETAVLSNHGLLTTVACNLSGKMTYALEGSIFHAGSAVQWLRDEMHLIDTAKESEIAATSVSDTDGVYAVPAFSGLGAPHWDMFARGTLIGITRGTNRNHIIRAVLESIAYQTFDILSAMVKDTGAPLRHLEVDGGACANGFLMQFQADILGCDVLKPKNIEATALGAAYLAALSCGMVHSPKDILSFNEYEMIYHPHMEESMRKKTHSKMESSRTMRQALGIGSGRIKKDHAKIA